MAKSADQPFQTVVFLTELGWMALVGHGDVVRTLSFGYATEKAALRGVENDTLVDNWNAPLVRRLEAYAEGASDQFLDVALDLSPCTTFQRRVLRACRKIPYGQTSSYGVLAKSAGSPRAARAVGQCMATNPIPLIIPCHRVLPSTGEIGSYSAPGGPKAKAKLLAMESAGS